MSEPQHAVTDRDIADCFDVMTELRPQLERATFVPLVRGMLAEGFRLACLREGMELSSYHFREELRASVTGGAAGPAIASIPARDSSSE
ncbi:MAG: hypothetical protein FJ191_02115 [Gammaproteobacteria bacterium]|nr:hypothetical protein [Gammaproteobacteria bacterium]